MSGRIRRDNKDENMLVNDTVDDDYVSELQKTMAGGKYAARSRNMTIMKIALLSALAFMAITLFIVAMITVAGKNDHSIEHAQDYNMFKGTQLIMRYLLTFANKLWDSYFIDKIVLPKLQYRAFSFLVNFTTFLIYHNLTCVYYSYRNVSNVANGNSFT